MAEEKKKVLVVDDDNNLMTVLVDKLDASGFNASGASDGEEGLAQALATHPDVILLDVMMPKMNGWETLEQLRKDAWGKDAKVIMLTVLEDMDYVAKGVEHNVHAYLVKTSLNLDEVVKNVKSALA